MKREDDSDNVSEQLLELAVKDRFDMVWKSWGIQDPIEELKKCIRYKQWFKGMALSTTFFEGIGAKVLLLRFRSQKILRNKKEMAQMIMAEKMIAEKIEDLSLNSILILLYALGIIEPSTYLKMVDVNQHRNDMVHKLSPFAKPQGRLWRRKIETTIECLPKLIYELHEEGKQFLLRPKKR